MTTRTASEIAEQLVSDGWLLTHHCTDDGSPDRESVWSVTLTHQGQSFTTEYHKGCAHRIWRKPKGAEAGVSIGGVSTQGIVYPGQRVGPKPRRMTLHIEQCWNTFTIPEPPTLDEVVWSLLMDSSGIRDGQTFEDWCSDYGSDDDSISARRSFDACREECWALIRMRANFDALDNLFQDY